jgi:hypothetical protein
VTLHASDRDAAPQGSRWEFNGRVGDRRLRMERCQKAH